MMLVTAMSRETILRSYSMWISVRRKSSSVNPMRAMSRPKRNRGTWKDSRTS